MRGAWTLDTHAHYPILTHSLFDDTTKNTKNNCIYIIQYFGHPKSNLGTYKKISILLYQ